MNETQLREFVNTLEPWCKHVRNALNQKSKDLRRAATSRKPDGTSLSDATKQELIETHTAVFHGINGDDQNPGILNTFPLFNTPEEEATP